MEKIVFVDLKRTNYYEGSDKNEIRFKLSGKDRRLLFNRKMTRELQTKKHTFVNIGVGQTTGSVYFVFNNNSGYPIGEYSNCKNLVLRGKSLVEFLKEHFGIADDVIFNVSENKANDPKFSTYVVSLPKETKATVEPIVERKSKEQKKTSQKGVYFGKLNASVDDILKLTGSDLKDLDISIDGLISSTINKYGTLKDVYDSDPKELIHRERGIGKKKVTFLQGMFHELGLNWGEQ